MQTDVSPQWQGNPWAQDAEAILRKCVHCGFCLAACPTYQVLGDERDSPRGRIYLIKQVLEGHTPTQQTQEHLDRCLTCRSCEAACPSGVSYGHLVEVGRQMVDQQVSRPWHREALRWLLRKGMLSPLFAPGLRVAQALRPWLPAKLKAKVPARVTVPVKSALPGAGAQADRIVYVRGCVQPALNPAIEAATLRVLNSAGFAPIVAQRAGCCGALPQHTGDVPAALKAAQANIDAWWPLLTQDQPNGKPVYLVSDASACGLAVKEYEQLLSRDPQYAQKAKVVSAACRDISEVIQQRVSVLAGKLQPSETLPVIHVPCTLQHGQRLPGLMDEVLGALGFTLAPKAAERHLCCGSAGTYSVLQPALSTQLRTRKLQQLKTALGVGSRAQHGARQVIVSANIGCIQHLQAGSDIPVQHWIELVDAALVA